VAQQVQWVL